MLDWIVGLKKGARSSLPGVSAEAWAQAQTELAMAAPDELRELYAAFDGATFDAGVVLSCLDTVVQNAQVPVPGVPQAGVWRFGVRGNQHLCAVRRMNLPALAGPAPLPEWAGRLPEEDWVFCLKDEVSGQLKVYQTLEYLLATLIPPVQAEEFGERTYARAMALVSDALGLGGKKKAARKKGKKKASPKKRPVKKKRR